LLHFEQISIFDPTDGGGSDLWKNWVKDVALGWHYQLFVHFSYV